MSRSNLLSQAEATRRIATWEIRPGEDRRKAEGRVRHRIRYAVKKGELTLQARNRLLINELAAWAEEKWPEQFDEGVLTGIPTARPRSLSATLDAMLLPAKGREQEALDAAWARIAELEADNATLRAELEALRDELAALRSRRQPPYPR